MMLDTSVAVHIDSVALYHLVQLAQGMKPDDQLQFKDFVPVIAAVVTSMVGAVIIWLTNKRIITNSLDIAKINANASSDLNITRSRLEQHNLWASELRSAASKFITSFKLGAEQTRILFDSWTYPKFIDS
jgi:hypothetical protein